MLLNVLGLVSGVVLLIQGDVSATTTLINLVWVFYNITIIGASIGVAYEKSHEWTTPQINAVIPASLVFANGKSLACETHSFSTQGVGLTLPHALDMAQGSEVTVVLFRGQTEYVFPATVVGSGRAMQLEFEQLTLEQQRQLTQMTFSRADNWATTWGRGPEDKLLLALKGVVIHGLMNVVPLFVRASHVYARTLPGQLTHQLRTVVDKARFKTRAGTAKARRFIQIPQFDFFRKK